METGEHGWKRTDVRSWSTVLCASALHYTIASLDDGTERKQSHRSEVEEGPDQPVDWQGTDGLRLCQQLGCPAGRQYMLPYGDYEFTSSCDSGERLYRTRINQYNISDSTVTPGFQSQFFKRYHRLLSTIASIKRETPQKESTVYFHFLCFHAGAFIVSIPGTYGSPRNPRFAFGNIKTGQVYPKTPALIIKFQNVK